MTNTAFGRLFAINLHILVTSMCTVTADHLQYPAKQRYLSTVSEYLFYISA